MEHRLGCWSLAIPIICQYILNTFWLYSFGTHFSAYLIGAHLKQPRFSCCVAKRPIDQSLGFWQPLGRSLDRHWMTLLSGSVMVCWLSDGFNMFQYDNYYYIIVYNMFQSVSIKNIKCKFLSSLPTLLIWRSHVWVDGQPLLRQLHWRPRCWKSGLGFATLFRLLSNGKFDKRWRDVLQSR